MDFLLKNMFQFCKLSIIFIMNTANIYYFKLYYLSAFEVFDIQKLKVTNSEKSDGLETRMIPQNCALKLSTHFLKLSIVNT